MAKLELESPGAVIGRPLRTCLRLRCLACGESTSGLRLTRGERSEPPLYSPPRSAPGGPPEAKKYIIINLYNKIKNIIKDKENKMYISIRVSMFINM